MNINIKRKYKNMIIIFIMVTLLLFAFFVPKTWNAFAASAEEQFSFEKGEYSAYTDSDYIYNSNSGLNETYTIQDYKDSLYKTTSNIELANSSFPDSYSAIATSDDPIVKIIPRELFENEGNHLYIGREYGFFVRTVDNPDTTYGHISTVLVFDIMKNLDMIDPYPSQIIVKITPIFEYNYYCLTNQIENGQGFYLGTPFGVNMFCDAPDNANSIIIPKPNYTSLAGEGETYYFITYAEETKYFIKNVSMSGSLRNEQELNIGQSGYIPQNDDGSFFTRTAFEYSGVGNQSQVNDAAYSTALLILGYVPYLGNILGVLDWGINFAHNAENEFRETIAYGECTSTEYYESRLEQLTHYDNLNKDTCAILTSEDKHPLLFGRVTGNDYVQCSFKVNMTDDWYTRFICSIGLQIVSEETGFWTDESTVTVYAEESGESIDFIRDEQEKLIDSSANNISINLLQGGSNVFAFIPESSGEYILDIDVPNDVEVNVKGGNINQTQNGENFELKLQLTQGVKYSIRVNYQDKGLLGQFQIGLRLGDVVFNQQKTISLSASVSYAFTYIPSNADGETVYNVYTNIATRITVYDSMGFVKYQGEGKNHYIALTSGSKYKVIIKNINTELKNISFVVKGIEAIEIENGQSINSATEYIYYKFIVPESNDYQILITSEGDRFVSVKDSLWEECNSPANNNGMIYLEDCAEDQILYVGVKSESATIMIYATNTVEKWIVNGVEIAGNEYELLRGESIDISLKIADVIINTFDFNVDDFSLVDTTFTLELNADLNKTYTVYATGVTWYPLVIIPKYEDAFEAFFENEDSIRLYWENCADLSEVTIKISAPNNNYVTYTKTGLKTLEGSYSNFYIIEWVGNDTSKNIITAPYTKSILTDGDLYNYGLGYSGTGNITVTVVSIKLVGDGNPTWQYIMPINKSFTTGAKFLAGTGASSNPYQISTYRHLDNIRDIFTNQVYFKMVNNIYCDENTNWTPISTFEGVFYGENYWINDLTIQYGLTTPAVNVSQSEFGLFKTNSGSIFNLGISGGSFTFYTYEATYSATLYCGFIAAKNYGVINGCEVLGTFFQFSCIYPQTTANVGLICGYNSGTVINCEVFEAAAQLEGGRGGGIVGWNENGTISNCEIGLSSVTCYQSFETEGENGYVSGHFAYIGGIVGHMNGGTLKNCTVASNVDVDYNGYPSTSLSLAPEIGNLIGRKQGSVTMSGNTTNDNIDARYLQSVKYSCGEDFWWWDCCYKKASHTHNQAKYVGSADNGDTGRIV